MSGNQIPLVDYLVLGANPHLVVVECASCGARFFGRRNSCAACFTSEFVTRDVPTEGIVETFTIVRTAAPGIEVPFVAAVIDCAGTAVSANLVGVEPDPDVISTGMKVQLALTSLGTDDEGTEAVGFGFAPITT
ncbi:hypothetical protein AB431_00745 [Mycobacterium sp. EPa45]|nr:OB-fold domain-containing protein [Mycobacterium sp. EPa45]AKK25483.1 hypothetical protein AB431_00745 [Mycobacterium sp. EPa45]